MTNQQRIAELESQLAELRAQDGSQRLTELSDIINEAFTEGKKLAKDLKADWTVTTPEGNITFDPGYGGSWDLYSWIGSSYSC